MKKFTYDDFESLRAGQTILGQDKVTGHLIGVYIPFTVSKVNKKLPRFIAKFAVKGVTKLSSQAWVGQMVTIYIDGMDEPKTMVWYKDGPRLYLPILWDEALANPDRTYYYFV